MGVSTLTALPASSSAGFASGPEPDQKWEGQEPTDVLHTGQLPKVQGNAVGVESQVRGISTHRAVDGFGRD